MSKFVVKCTAVNVGAIAIGDAEINIEVPVEEVLGVLKLYPEIINMLIVVAKELKNGNLAGT